MLKAVTFYEIAHTCEVAERREVPRPGYFIAAEGREGSSKGGIGYAGLITTLQCVKLSRNVRAFRTFLLASSIISWGTHIQLDSLRRNSRAAISLHS